jgi:hypothetical protein
MVTIVTLRTLPALLALLTLLTLVTLQAARLPDLYRNVHRFRGARVVISHPYSPCLTMTP